MKSLSDPKVKKKYKLLEELKDFLLKEPQPYLNLDQIDYLLIGDESDEDSKVLGLCQLCSLKSKVMKTIKRSASGALGVIHDLLFSPDYFFRD